jgi:hypothetical protein
LFETTEATDDAVDELQGKLLDFDKFRSLEGASASPIAIDEKLLQAITGYSSKIDQAENAAQKLADTWLKFWINEETGGLTEDADRVLTVMEGLVKVLGILLSIKVAAWLGHLVKGLFAVKIAGQSLNTLVLAVIIYSVLEMVDAIKKGDKGMALFAGSIALVSGAILVLKSQKLTTWFIDTAQAALQACKNISLMNGLMMALGATILAIGVKDFIQAWDDMSGVQRAIGIFAALAGAITAAAIAFKATHNWAQAIGIAATVAGGALAVTSAIKIPNYEMGASDIDSGTVFRAGEFGKTEAVYTGSNGKTNVANVKQIEQAQYNALVRYHSQHRDDDRPIVVYLDGEKDYENTTAKAKARGNV